MNKDLLKIALIGLVAGFCISAKEVPAKKSQETAMSKCTKENGKKKKCRGSCSDDKGCGSGGGSSYGTTNRYDGIRNNYSTEEYSPKANEIAAKRKSAAQKVMEGY